MPLAMQSLLPNNVPAYAVGGRPVRSVRDLLRNMRQKTLRR